MYAAWAKDRWHTLERKKINFESLKMSTWANVSFSIGIQIRKVRLTNRLKSSDNCMA